MTRFLRAAAPAAWTVAATLAASLALCAPAPKPAAKQPPQAARVLVEAIIPLQVECHGRTLRMLQALAKEEPKRVSVKLVDLAGSEGQALVKARKTNCATVFVNGAYVFDLKGTAAKPRHLELWHRPNDADSLYHSEDVIDVVQARLKAAYGHGMPDEVVARVKAAGDQPQKQKDPPASPPAEPAPANPTA